jgi:hypothetical protein
VQTTLLMMPGNARIRTSRAMRQSFYEQSINTIK